MADMADDLIEDGMQAWLLHLSGQCDTVDECQYCAEGRAKKGGAA